MHAIEFTVDETHVTTTDKTLTASAILALAGIDPLTHYLVELRGKQQISYEGKVDEPIKVHPNQEFLSVRVGPAPLS